MDFVKLGNFDLVYFDKANVEHFRYYKFLVSDESITSKFQGIFPALVSRNSFFDKGFFIRFDGEFIGCVIFGKYNLSERNIYIRGFAIDKNHRGMMFDNKRLSQAVDEEICNYIFNSYPEIDSIFITVSPENGAGNKSAIRYGYSHVTDTRYSKSR